MNELNDNRHFEYSVIIPIYNVEEYLSETIESVINQTVGFQDNIQLILVNDGSPDCSADICKQYHKQYPENIVYLEQENKGVSSARNLGMQYALGKYVNFLDADDKWDSEAFSHISKFFKANPEIEMAFARLFFYVNRENDTYHLDYEYKKTRIVDVDETWDFPQISVARGFIARRLLTGREFDESLALSEDVLFLNDIILDEKKYGVVREAIYYYRQRDEKTSALDTAKQSKEYYLITPEKVYKRLIDISEKKRGCIIAYIQYLLITDLQWRLRRTLPNGILTSEEEEKYRATVREILECIDDNIIVSQRHMDIWLKAYTLRAKYGEDYTNQTEAQLLLARKLKVVFTILNEKGNRLCISGNANEKHINDNYYLYLRDDLGNKYEAEYRDYSIYDRTGLFPEIVMKGRMFNFKLPLQNVVKYTLHISDGTEEVRQKKMYFGRFSRLVRLEGSHFKAANHLLKYEKDRIIVSGFSQDEKDDWDRMLEKTIMEKEPGDAREIMRVRKKVEERKNSRRPIWIITDSSTEDHCPGLALFNYISSKLISRVDAYYVVDKDETMPEGKGAQNNKRILIKGSEEHLVTLLSASAVITSCPDAVDAFWKKIKYYRDLENFHTVFLYSKSLSKSDITILHNLRANYYRLFALSEDAYRDLESGNLGYETKALKTIPSEPKKCI